MRFLLVYTVVLFALLAAAWASAEQPEPSTGSPVLKATFDVLPQRPDRQRVTFSKRAAHVGDEVEQTLAVEMRMATTLRQGNQIGQKNRTTARNHQRRVVKTTHVVSNLVAGVRVHYLEATRQVLANADAQTSALATGNSSNAAQPVAGKTYLCHRQPGKDDRLVVTDEAGHIPPKDEYEIVTQHMEMIGRPNPLAEFLAGRSITVGQAVNVSNDIASQIFNLGEQFGEVSRFTLTLEKLAARDGATSAVFAAHIEATSNNASQMRLELDGRMVVETGTCRAVKVDLSGPIAMSETRGSYSTSYQVIGTGQLKTSIASAFRDAAK